MVWAIPLLAQVVVTCLLKSSYPSGWPLQSLSLTPSSLVDENLPVPSTLCVMHSAGLGHQQVTFHLTWQTPLLLRARWRFALFGFSQPLLGLAIYQGQKTSKFSRCSHQLLLTRGGRQRLTGRPRPPLPVVQLTSIIFALAHLA